MSSDAPRVGRNVPDGTVVTQSGAIMRPDTAAYAQFQGEFGIHGNAEDLIEAHRRSQNAALRTASLLQVDPDATKEAKDDLKGSAKKLGISDDMTLTDVTVRGHALIGVVEYPNGVSSKVVGGWDDDYAPPRMSPDEAADAAAAERQAELHREVANLRADFAQQFEDLRVEHEQKLAEELQRVREAADKDASKASEKAAKQAEKENAKADSSTSTRSSGSNGRRRAGGRRRSTSTGRSGARSSSRKPGAKGDQRTGSEKANETKGDENA